MKSIKFKKNGSLLLILTFSIITLAWTAQQILSSGETIEKDVIDSGGGISSNSEYTLLDAFGQPTPVGISSNSEYTLHAGFITPESSEWSGEKVVTSDIIIPENHTLFIQPGTTIRFEPKSGFPLEKLKIDVEGTLNAVGTEQAPILFAVDSPSPAPSDWTGIVFSPSSVSNELKYCQIEYAAIPLSFEGKCLYFGFDCGGVDLVENCDISHFYIRGISVINGRDVNIVNNRIHHGAAESESAVFCGGNTTVSGNLIYNVNTGIAVENWGIAEINNNAILDFSVHGISIKNCRAQIINNVIHPRFKSGAGGYPIYENTEAVRFFDTYVMVKNNIINSAGYKPAVFSEGIADSVIELAYNDLLGYPNQYVGCVDLGGNVSVDPQFENESDTTNIQRDSFKLVAGSPCINAGDPDIKDVDRTLSDMGIWGGPTIPPPQTPPGLEDTLANSLASSHFNSNINSATNAVEKYLQWPYNYIGQYNIYRALQSGGPYKKINTNPVMDNQYYIGNFLEGYYILRSLKDTIESYNSLEKHLVSGTAPQFTDFAAGSGVAETKNGSSPSFCDFDNDNYPDIFIAVPSGNNKLYRNNQNGTFTDVSQKANISATTYIGIWGDYDNDGWTDLFATRLYHNNGDGTFTNISDSAGLGSFSDCYGASFGDYDNDWDLDLFVSQVKFTPCKLFQNNGDGTFTDATESSGLNIVISARQSAFSDFDNDGDPDLFVTGTQTGENRYLRNNGDDIFTDATSDAGFANSDGTSIAVGDYNNDGFFDLFITDYPGNRLYHNNGDGTFTDISQSAGLINDGSDAQSAQWGDFDKDGFLDIYIINSGNQEKNALYRNNGDGTFENISDLSNVGNSGQDSKCTLSDYDRDGDTDIYITRYGNPNILYQNSGNQNHWLSVKTIGTESNRDGIGARVIVKTSLGKQIQEVSGGTGTGNDPVLFFGLGEAELIDSLIVEWPGGIMNSLTEITSDQLIEVTETRTATFADIAQQTGLYDAGETCGSAFTDYNNDGYWDIYVFNNNSGNRLYKNTGPPEWNFANVTGQAGVANDSSGSGPAFVDYNNDGYTDLFLANNGSKVLFRNNGNGTFADVSESAGIIDQGNINGYAFGDINNDGYLDLFLANWESPNALYQNSGPPEWQFTDITAEAGVGYSGTSHGCVFGDYDNDGDLDIYVSTYTGLNLLYQNNNDSTFTNVASQAGVTCGDRCRGVSFGDYNNDGNLDLYVTRGRFESNYSNVLYQNNGDGTFTDVSAEKGVDNSDDGSLSIFGDYDNDGTLDIYVANSGQHQNPENVLYKNNGPPDWTFTEVSSYAGVQKPDYASCAGFWDYNNDGFLDIYVANSKGQNLFYINHGNENHWLKIQLIGSQNNRNGIGARVKVTANNLSQIREADGSNPGYHSFNCLPLSFGLGKATLIDSIIVTWPSGSSGILTNLPVDTLLRIEEEIPTDVADKEIEGIPNRFILSQNYPNPFNSTTTIQYGLKKSCVVQINVYNILGQIIVTLIDKKQDAGYHSVIWDGKNKYGINAASGIYLYHIRAADFVCTKKIVLMK